MKIEKPKFNWKEALIEELGRVAVIVISGWLANKAVGKRDVSKILRDLKKK